MQPCSISQFVVPEQGMLNIKTEFGKMVVAPGEICVIQASELNDSSATSIKQ